MVIPREIIQQSQNRLTFRPDEQARKLADTGGRRLSPQKQEQRLRTLVSATGDVARARAQLERIIQGNDLTGINYLAKGTLAARSVCRIQLRTRSGFVEGYGTGFLCGPEVLMTNWHVLKAAASAQFSIAEFEYETDINGKDRTAVPFSLEPGRLFYSNKALDFAVVAVAPRSRDGVQPLSQYRWLPLSAEPGKSEEGEYLTIIQHPGGERKQVCVRENKLLKYLPQTLWYQTDTLGGSSGSPVFNGFWQVVALHHSGVPREDKNGNWLTRDGRIWQDGMGDHEIDWIANEGIRISAIAQHLRDALGSHPLVKRVLAAGEAPTAPESAVPGSGGLAGNGHEPWFETDGATASLVVPVRVPIEMVRTGAAGIGGAGLAVAMAPAPPPEDDLVEKVVIDHSTLGSRPGYKTNFVGTGKLSVPLPRVPASVPTGKLKGKPGEVRLKYFNYSVVMHSVRKLAIFSAVNIDGKLRRDVGKRQGDRWFKDPRLDDKFQLGDEFYKHQRPEEGREENPFDRGHLVRRLDATWGKSIAEAKEHGDDTFHYTNAAPQFFSFNQGKRLWLGIEEFVLGRLEEDKQKGCVINGPVFDGPEAEDNGHPDPDAPRRKDPTFLGVAIPKYFWKLVAVEEDGELAVSAFLLSQQDQVMGIDRIQIEELTAKEARVFQTSVANLAKLTGLNFGKLAQADTQEAAREMGPRPLERLEDIRFS